MWHTETGRSCLQRNLEPKNESFDTSVHSLLSADKVVMSIDEEKRHESIMDVPLTYNHAVRQHQFDLSLCCSVL